MRKLQRFHAHPPVQASFNFRLLGAFQPKLDGFRAIIRNGDRFASGAVAAG